jgi:O-antigen ligase
MILYMGYLGAFWNASGPLAQPARAVKSVISPDPRDEKSNLYRYIETANVRLNIHANPITGLGFGSEYIFYYSMPDLSFWPFWHYIPHNTFLWVWMKMGSFGILAFLMICGSGLVRGVQLLKRANDDRAAPALVALVSCLLMLVVYSYVDVALTNVRADLLLGFVLGAIGMWGRSTAQGVRS